MTAPLQFHQVDVHPALTEFDMGFQAALVPLSIPWARTLGRVKSTNLLKTTFPIAISDGKFVPFVDEMKARKNAHKSITLEQELWHDGVEEFAHKIEAVDFDGFAQEPEAMADSANRAPNEWVTTKMVANAACDYDGVAFFHASNHLINPFGPNVAANKFGNLLADKPLNITNLELMKTTFRGMKSPGGASLGLSLTDLLVPTALMETALDLQKRNLIILGNADTASAVDNRHQGTFRVHEWQEATDANNWAGFALNKPALRPFIVMVKNNGVPERIFHSKADSKYKNTLKVGVNMILVGTAGLALPQCAILATNA